MLHQQRLERKRPLKEYIKSVSLKRIIRIAVLKMHTHNFRTTIETAEDIKNLLLELLVQSGELSSSGHV